MLIIKKRTLVIVGTLVITAITFFACFGALKNQTGDVDAQTVRVVLDAGHGGIDGGVTGVKTGVKESELNLKVVKKVSNYLTSAGIAVTLTRTSDAGLYGVATKNLKRKDMEERKRIIEKAEPVCVVSVHMNKYPLSTRRGAQVFYESGDENGKLLAESIQEAFNGMDEATRKCSALAGDYYMVKCTKYPSVICECGFLSNQEDEALLITDEYQEKIAYEIFKGVISYLSKASFKFF